MDELYINGRLIDMYDKQDEPVAFSFQVNNIAEFKDIQANFTNTFKIPKTRNNVHAMGNADMVGSESNVPYRQLTSRYIRKGVDLLDNGIAILEDSIEDFDITIYSGNFDFFAQIGDKTIQDLDFSEYNHVLDIATIQSLNTANGNLIWPLAQYGGYRNDGIVDIRYIAPAFKFPAILTKIFDTTTWGFSGTILSDPKFTNELLPLLENKVVDTDELLLSRSAQYGTIGFQLPRKTYQPPGFSDQTYLSMLADARFDVIAPPNFESEAGYVDRSDSTWYYYRAQQDVIIDIELNLFFQYSTVYPISVWINKPKGSGNGFGRQVYTTLGNIPLGQNFFNTMISGVRLFPGDYVTIISNEPPVSGTIPTYLADGTIVGDPTNKAYIKFTATNSTPVDGMVNYNGLTPKIKMSEFVRNICNQFGIILQPNYRTGNIEFKQFKQIRGANVKKDWSNKVDLSRPVQIKYRRPEFGQATWLRWIQDDSVFKIGDGFFSIDDTTLDVSADLFTMDYASSVQYQISDLSGPAGISVKIPRFVQAQANNYNSQVVYNSGDTALYNGTVYVYINVTPSSGHAPGDAAYWRVYIDQYDQSEDATQRVLYYRIAGNFKYTDGTNTVGDGESIPIAYFADRSQAYDLDFVNILIREYQPIVDMMQRYKELIVYVRLTEVDIQQLDFFKMIFIELLGNNFYLTLVGEYQADEPSTACTLIRI